MTKFTKLTLIGSITILAIFLLCIALMIATLAKGSQSTAINPAGNVRVDTVLVEKVIRLGPDTVRIPVSCKKNHCEESKPKPDVQTDSTITQ